MACTAVAAHLPNAAAQVLIACCHNIALVLAHPLTQAVISIRALVGASDALNTRVLQDSQTTGTRYQSAAGPASYLADCIKVALLGDPTACFCTSNQEQSAATAQWPSDKMPFIGFYLCDLECHPVLLPQFLQLSHDTVSDAGGALSIQTVQHALHQVNLDRSTQRYMTGQGTQDWTERSGLQPYTVEYLSVQQNCPAADNSVSQATHAL